MWQAVGKHFTGPEALGNALQRCNIESGRPDVQHIEATAFFARTEPQHQVIEKQAQADAVEHADQPVVIDVVLDEVVAATEKQRHRHGAGGLYAQVEPDLVLRCQHQRHGKGADAHRAADKLLVVAKAPVCLAVVCQQPDIDFIKNGVVGDQPQRQGLVRRIHQRCTKPAGVVAVAEDNLVGAVGDKGCVLHAVERAVGGAITPALHGGGQRQHGHRRGQFQQRHGTGGHCKQPPQEQACPQP